MAQSVAPAPGGRETYAALADNRGDQGRSVMRRARILVDDIAACASGGDLNYALRAGAMSKHQVHADLADLAAGRMRGRMTEDEFVTFDSSGSGVQDVAAAGVAYREASRTGIGMRFDLSGSAREQ